MMGRGSEKEEIQIEANGYDIADASLLPVDVRCAERLEAMCTAMCTTLRRFGAYRTPSTHGLFDFHFS